MSAIKPPDGKPGSSSVLGGGGAAGNADAAAPERAGSTFRDALEQAGAAGKGGSGPAPEGVSAGRPDALGELAQAVRSGTLSPDQAVAQLVERAVSGLGSKLSETQRLELTAVLREALENDPALAELRKAIG